MITNKPVSASFSEITQWSQINWQQCNKNTLRLQNRIVRKRQISCILQKENNMI